MLDIGQWLNKKFPLKEINELNLTIEQKLEDFDYLCNVLENGMPSIQIIESEFNIDYTSKKEYYRSLISQSSNDYEFYCIINSYMNLIPSTHTQLYYPDYENYSNRFVNHMPNVLAIRGIEQYTDYWNKLLDDKARSFEYEDYCSAQYMESTGKYYINDGMGGAEVISVDNVPVDEYVMSVPLCTEIKYDAINKKVMRDFLLFTSNETEYGTPVTIKVKCTNGDIGEIKMYDGLYNDFSVYNSLNKDVSISEDAAIELAEYEIINDDNNNLIYANISKINNNNSELIKSELENRKYDTVILDLRNNSGGMQNLFFDSVYTPLVKEDTTAYFPYYVPRTFVNNKRYFYAYFMLGFFHDHIYKDLSYTDKTNLPEMNADYVEYSNQYDCTGNHNKNADIYILISSDTASAADKLTAVLKTYANAIAIGNDTKGEGLGCSSVADALPNSKLVFEYYPAAAYNFDGTNNTLHGTSPDYYVYSKNSIQKQILNDIYDNGENIFTYENRLKWDNVLIKTLEIIKEDKNEQRNNSLDE